MKTKMTAVGTGFVYDEYMTSHRHVFNKKHPECPERITVAYQYLKDKSVLSYCVPVLERFAEANFVYDMHTIWGYIGIKSEQKMQIVFVMPQSFTQIWIQ